MGYEDQRDTGEFPSDLEGLGLTLVRRIDAVCRRFEADWREGRRRPIDDYLADVPDEGRPALRTELEELERELRRSDDIRLPSLPITNKAGPSVHDEVPRSPRDEATVD